MCEEGERRYVAPWRTNRSYACFLSARSRRSPSCHGSTARCASKSADNILDDPQDAEECVNDAWLGAWNSIPPQRPDPLRAYVCRIVRNLSLKKLRANSGAEAEQPV